MNREYREGIASTFDVPKVDFDCPFGVNPEDTPKSERAPTLMQMVNSAAKAAAETVVEGLKGEQVISEKTEAERRLAICKACPHFQAEAIRCKICGCLMGLKSKQKSAKCPQGKW
jgi:hypothetical protein